MIMMAKSLVALLVVLSFNSSVWATFSYSITPARATLCPVEGVPCLTLSEFADELDTLYDENLTSYSSDIELIFEPGKHNLDTELAVLNIRLSSFTIRVANNASSLEGLEEVRITCDTSARFTILAVDQVLINGIEFVDCAANVITFVDKLVLEDCSFIGRGSLAVKWTRNVTVFQSSFSLNFNNTSDNGTGIVAGFYVYFSENVLIQSSRFHESVTMNESSVCFENSTVTMLDTTFTCNVVYGRYGDVFLVYSNVTAENCTFENNTVYHKDIGAIVSYKSFLVISNCNFLENNYYSSQLGVGGALICVSSIMLVNNSLFHSNYAGALGGAVYASYSIVTVNNSQFLNNSALYIGGAIYCSDSSVITMDNSTFINNTARQYYGGAVYYVRNGAVNIYKSTFISNIANESGGAVFSRNCTLTEVVDSTFYNNSAPIGGALNIYNSLTGTIHNTIFVNNSAKAAILSEENVYVAHGGALFIILSNVSINQSVFNNNSVSLTHYRSEDFHQQTSQFNVDISGGAIASIYSDITISITVFQHNDAYVDVSKASLSSQSIDTSCYGGAVRIQYGHLIVQNSHFLKNVANCSFGNTPLKHNANISHIEEDSDPIALVDLYAAGGAIIMLELSESDTIVEDSIFLENMVLTNGVVVDNSTIFSSIASDGGAIFVGLNTALKIKGSNFSHNSANASHSSSILSVDVSISGTSVTSGGGALISKLSSNITIEESVYIGNRAYAISTVGGNSSVFNDISSSGGAIYIGNSEFIVVDSTTFSNNTAIFGSTLCYSLNSSERENSTNKLSGSVGGAMSIFQIGNVKITNSEFEDNTAMGGGAVAIFPSNHSMGGPAYETATRTFKLTEKYKVLSTGFVEMENCTFRKNNATALAGGAVYVYNGTIVIRNCTFDNNKAGGDMHIGGTLYKNYYDNGDSELLIADCPITNAGAIFFGGSTCDMYACKFTNNTDTAVIWSHSSATISNIIFENNTGTMGGVAEVLYSTIKIVNSTLVKNRCSNDFGYVGGVFSIYSSVTIVNCTIVGNQCQERSRPFRSAQGAVSAMNSALLINNTMFADNTANSEIGIGGAVSALYSTVVINHSIFSNCSTNNGGAIYSSLGNVTITSSEFYNNEASNNSYGGALFITDGPVLLQNCIFSSNGPGGAIALNSVSLVSKGYLMIQNGVKEDVYFTSVVINSTVFFYGNTILSNNSCPLVVFFSNVTFAGHTNITNNTLANGSNGGIAAIQSEIVFTNQTCLMNNSGRNNFGGALSVSETKIYMYGDISISHNTASYGGGIYMYQSELNVFGKAEIVGNRAIERGGGIYADSSSIRLMKGSLHLRQNNAMEEGGGMYLRTHSKIYVVKSISECRKRSDPVFTFCLYSSYCKCNDNSETWLMLKFTENHAHLGGAVFITDDTNSDTCAANTLSTTSVCFFQSFVTLSSQLEPALHIHTLNTYFINNSASGAGGTIFGGLLDRCHMNSFSELFEYYIYSRSVSALSYLTKYNLTNLQEENIQSEISSFPVRVCFCRDSEPDCSYHPQALQVRKGEQFTVSIVAVDQVNNTIPNTTIYSSVSPLAGLKEGQAIQDTGDNCTDLTYNVVSPYDSERLSLYAEGPCKNIGMSVTSIGLTFTSCPVGFIMSEKSCNCDPHIYPECVQTCSIDTESVLRRDNAWVSYLSYDNTTGQHTFLTHLHCPFDYCQPPNEDVWMNFNILKGEDVQCVFNRSGILCGACEEGLSLALGSSHCLPCSNNWLALVIPFALAGIALVAFLLVCNMTVAEGTINGLIFYANIIATNQAILTPIDESNVLSIFVAWLNLDLGIETCFFDGMDSYAKVWLQLAFPLYVIFLVILVIVICEHSQRITRLLSRKNPLTTLATLILLSYTKLLTVIISAFSFTTLEFHDGSTRRAVWLMDANIEYFEWKHTLLFITALVILIVGIVYTFVLFSLQWLMKISNRFIFKWVNSPRLLPLMESYHGPYNLKHRYWTGLLLIVRVLLYLVYALNIQGDPSVNLLTILCVCVLLLAFSNLAGRIYKNWLINAIEVSVLFNLTLLSAGMLYIQETKRHRFQPVLARVSIAVAFLTFLLVLCYHMYKFVLAKYLEKLKHRLVQIKTKNRSYHSNDGQQPVTSMEFEFETFNEGDGYSVTEINGLPPIDDNATAATIESTTLSLDGEEELCDSDHEEDDETRILV